MARYSAGFLLPLVLVAGIACRDQTPATATSSTTTADANASGSVANGTPAPAGVETLRTRLDRIQPAIPLYPGANPQRESGDIVDLVTDDPFPMVWHYYVTYLEQFRAWDHPAPFPARNQTSRRLVIPLAEIMKDPFVPGTAIPDGATPVTLELRELPTGAGTSIRYRFGEAVAEAGEEASPDAAEVAAGGAVGAAR